MKTLTLTFDRDDGVQEKITAHLLKLDRAYVADALLDVSEKLRKFNSPATLVAVNLENGKKTK